MPVFDFKNAPEEKAKAVCTYTIFQSSESTPSPEKPIMLIDNSQQQWKHHLRSLHQSSQTHCFRI